MAEVRGVNYDIGYLQPKPLQPVPVSQPFNPGVQGVSKDTQSWFDKFVNVASKVFTGLYAGAMGALDIYGRYKAIERGQEPVFTQQPAQQPVVVLGQEIPKNYLIIGGVVLAVIVLLIILRR